MTTYKVGALSDLISSSSNTSAQLSHAELFTTANKQKDKPWLKHQKVQLPKIQPKPIKASAIESPKAKVKVTPKASPKKDRKRKLDNPEDSEEVKDDTEAPPAKYDKPSLKSKVRHEDRKERIVDPEKDARTVFVGNLPASIKKKKLKQLFGKFGDVESVRLRGAARPDMKTTKKVAVITKTFHDQRHNINGYVVFKDPTVAKKATKLNGLDLDGFILRVDTCLDEKPKKDPKRAVFLGNLAFSLEENEVRNHFKRCGNIVDVRIVRDKTGGVGKGFGYVNFKSADSVQMALELNGTSLTGRELRVERCSKKGKVTAPFSSQRSVPMKVKYKKTNEPITKKVTRKKVKDMEASQYQGTTAIKDKSAKKKWKQSKGQAKRKQLAAVLSKV